MHVALAGNAEQMAESFEQAGIAIGLGVLVIFMVLAAQFESWVQPLTVMLALPLAMTGALGALWLFGHSLNLFSLIGIILLFGLVTKNSILLVDYAQQLRAGGMDKVEAIRTAAPIRMRPVLMTALAMIFGVIPAAIGVGPGSETRAPMAIATGAGMLSSTVLTLLVVPVFYIVFDDFAEWVKGGFRRASRAQRQPSEDRSGKPAEAAQRYVRGAPPGGSVMALTVLGGGVSPFVRKVRVVRSPRRGSTINTSR